MRESEGHRGEGRERGREKKAKEKKREKERKKGRSGINPCLMNRKFLSITHQRQQTREGLGDRRITM